MRKQHWQASLGSVCHAEGHRFCSVGNEGSHFEHNDSQCFLDLLHALLFKCVHIYWIHGERRSIAQVMISEANQVLQCLLYLRINILSVKTVLSGT